MTKKIDIHVSELRAFVIVIRNDPASEFYFSKIDPLWEDVGVILERFDACTPTNAPRTLRFYRNESQKYKHLIRKSKDFTPSEKACWYSHYLLWKKCVETNKPLLIVEHDCVPFNPANLYFSKKENFRSFDKGAMGCYLMTPLLADFICRVTEREGVYSGPLGHIEFWYRQLAGRTGTDSGERFVAPSTKGYNIACTQIMHSKFGNTIDHYSGTDAASDEKIMKKAKFPFLMIDNLPEKLTVEVLQQQRHLYDYIEESLSKKKSPEGL